MATIEATLALNDKQYRQALERMPAAAQKASARAEAAIRREEERTARRRREMLNKGADFATKLGASFVAAGKLGVDAMQRIADRNDLARQSIERTTNAANRFIESIGRDLSAGGAGNIFADIIESADKARTATVNFLADMAKGARGAGAEIDRLAKRNEALATEFQSIRKIQEATLAARLELASDPVERARLQNEAERNARAGEFEGLNTRGRDGELNALRDAIAAKRLEDARNQQAAAMADMDRRAQTISLGFAGRLASARGDEDGALRARQQSERLSLEASLRSGGYSAGESGRALGMLDQVQNAERMRAIQERADREAEAAAERQQRRAEALARLERDRKATAIEIREAMGDRQGAEAARVRLDIEQRIAEVRSNALLNEAEKTQRISQLQTLGAARLAGIGEEASLGGGRVLSAQAGITGGAATAQVLGANIGSLSRPENQTARNTGELLRVAQDIARTVGGGLVPVLQ